MIRSSDEIDGIQRKVDDCMNVLVIPRRNGGPGYDERSQEFISDMQSRLDDGDRWFSDKQIKWLGDLHNRI